MEVELLSPHFYQNPAKAADAFVQTVPDKYDQTDDANED